MRIPNGQNFIQKGDTELFPHTDLASSQGIYPDGGKLTFPGRFLINTSSSVSNFGLPTDILFKGAEGWFAICGDRIFKNGATDRSPLDSFTEDAASGTPTTCDPNSSFAIYPKNDGLYVNSNATTIKKWNGAAWSTLSNTITAGGIRRTVYHRATNKMYGTYSTSKITSWDDGDTVIADGSVGSSQYSLNIGASSVNIISDLVSTPDWLWILTKNLIDSSSRQLYWDGSQTSPNGFATLDTHGALAGWSQYNTLFIITTDGRIMENNGKTFIERARFPFGEKLPINSLLDSYDTSIPWVHPNGVKIIDGKPNFIINPEFADSSDPDYRLLAGQWELDPLNDWNLYMKRPFSLSTKSKEAITDYGQIRISKAGALASAKHSTSDNGTILAGVEYFTNATSTAKAIVIDDTADTLQKYASITLGWVTSQKGLKDKWQSLQARIGELLNSSDKIIVKYRTKKDTPVIVTGTWASTSTFTTSTDLRGYEGWEVTVLNGTGGGKAAHITRIDGGPSSWTVNLDDTFSGVTTGTFKARVEKWTKCAAEFSSQLDDVPEFAFSRAKDGAKIQVKICFQVTGKNELLDLYLNNNKAQ